MEKTIILKNDEVFRHSVRLNTNRSYTTNAEQCAESVRETIFDLVKLRKLDATDLRIIDARDGSPMPSMRKVGIEIGLDVANVHRRVQRIRDLIVRGYSPIRRK